MTRFFRVLLTNAEWIISVNRLRAERNHYSQNPLPSLSSSSSACAGKYSFTSDVTLFVFGIHSTEGVEWWRQEYPSICIQIVLIEYVIDQSPSHQRLYSNSVIFVLLSLSFDCGTVEQIFAVHDRRVCAGKRIHVMNSIHFCRPFAFRRRCKNISQKGKNNNFCFFSFFDATAPAHFHLQVFVFSGFFSISHAMVVSVSLEWCLKIETVSVSHSPKK